MNLTEQETRLIEALRKAEVKDPVELVKNLITEYEYEVWEIEHGPDAGGIQCDACGIITFHYEKVGDSEEGVLTKTVYDHAPDCPGILSERLAAILKEEQQ